MTIKHTIFVCQSCATKWQDGKPVGESGGSLVYRELMAQFSSYPLVDEFEIRPVSCLGACGRSCAIAFSAYGKSTYLFGDIDHNESLTEVSASILECATLYHSKPDGVMKWSERPDKMKKGVVGVIPSIEKPAIV